MSSRALRKLQREQEDKRQADKDQQAILKEDDDDEDTLSRPAEKKAFNAFDMLKQVEEEEAGSDRASPTEEDGDSSTPALYLNEPSLLTGAPNTKAKPAKKKKKKGKGGKEKLKTAAEVDGLVETAEPQDEIDAALASLSIKTQDGSYAMTNTKVDESKAQLCRLLAVESKYLNAVNEMKRLFGNIMTEDESPSANGRRRGRGPQQLDLGAALTARHSPVSKGQGLSGLVLRRNVFMSGKEEWPKAPSGGLGMEMSEKDEDGIRHYRFIHNTAYQDVQRQFQSCVESMDPQRMISMLQFNPYHISTLLQVSEIAKQQGDHSVSGDLLERALFSFGRSVQSSFSNALTEGKARLDFRRPENREFWLAAWRYIANLGQRGTWRTAYEWAKLLLSLDPEGDPYCVMMVFDQLALRGGQAKHFLDLTKDPTILRTNEGRCFPNLEISLSLAEYKLKRPKDCRSTLSEAVSYYPWIFARLFKELNIEHLPPSIWGKEPRTPRETLDTEVYIWSAKDLWNTPENIQFLVEVVNSAERDRGRPPTYDPLTLSEARHVLLSDNRSLIAFLPRAYTASSSSALDPLPPPDNIESYSTALPQPSHGPAPAAYTGPFDSDDETPPPVDSPPLTPPPAPASETTPNASDSAPPPTGGLRGLFSRLMAWPNPNADPPLQTDIREPDGPPPGPEDTAYEVQLARLLAERQAANQPTVDSASESDSESSYDEDRNKRWLAGQGLQAVKAFVQEHGAAEVQGENAIKTYVQRLKQLREINRRFILDYALPQGAGREAKSVVEREMRR